MVYYNQGFLFTGPIVVFTVIPIRVEFIYYFTVIIVYLIFANSTNSYLNDNDKGGRIETNFKPKQSNTSSDIQHPTWHPHHHQRQYRQPSPPCRSFPLASHDTEEHGGLGPGRFLADGQAALAGGRLSQKA